MTRPMNCNTSMGGATATAGVGYTLDLPFTAASSGYIGASIEANTNPTPTDPTLYSSSIATGMSADASITLQYTLTTAGPIRPGYVEIDRLLSAAGSDYRNSGGVRDDFADVNAAIGNAVSVVCPEDYGFECAPSGPGTLFPITLGQPFVFSEQITIDTSDWVGGMGELFNYGDYLESGSAELNFNFRLVEADETTPVAVELVPEPSTFGLLAVIGVLMVGSRRMRLDYRGKGPAATSSLQGFSSLSAP